ncbi:ABC transporter ATP-binding protein [Bacillaceae bacterium C204]|uniref:ABC transporter ATP-binding protein n=1 Tax=Neobacillus sp. 204 TaxID=3383351 RepID=UPI00397B5E76
MAAIISIENVEREFGSGEKRVRVLKGIDLSIKQHTLVALKGRSGSGKTTLLNLIGALDQPSKGCIFFEETDIGQFSEKERTEFRRKRLGLIFQSFGLVPFMTVEENVEFGLRVAGTPREEWQTRIKDALELVGLTKRAKHLPFELSGGEQQRCAIARTIASSPSVILADEPTAELDSKMAFHIIKQFKYLVDTKKTTIIMTTHDQDILDMMEHVFELEDGRIAHEKTEAFS